jgi:hypothetical protein
VPCVITNFSHQLSSDVDYIQVPITNTILEDVEVAAAGPNSGPNLFDIGNGQFGETNVGAVAPNFGSKKAALNANNTYTQSQYKSIVTSTRVPTASTISITLRTVYSRKNLHDRFDLNKFAKGELLADKDKGYGGFL